MKTFPFFSIFRGALHNVRVSELSQIFMALNAAFTSTLRLLYGFPNHGFLGSIVNHDLLENLLESPKKATASTFCACSQHFKMHMLRNPNLNYENQYIGTCSTQAQSCSQIKFVLKPECGAACFLN